MHQLMQVIQIEYLVQIIIWHLKLMSHQKELLKWIFGIKKGWTIITRLYIYDEIELKISLHNIKISKKW